MAAAAEYRRQSSPKGDDFAGFEGVAALSQDLGKDLQRFLHPNQDLKPLFDAWLTYQRESRDMATPLSTKNKLALARKVLPHLKPYWRGPLRNTGLLTLGGFVLGAGLAGGAIGLLVGLVQLVIGTVSKIQRDLKANDYGMLPGITQPGHRSEGLMNWLADEIDRIAGNDSAMNGDATPLTMGDLWRAGIGDADLGDAGTPPEPSIQLAAMTTDLTSKRPFALPFTAQDLYYFDPRELRRVLPGRIVDYMVQQSKDRVEKGPNGKLYPVPVGADFPVVLAARLSLSFPILLQTVPLWRLDPTPIKGEKWVKCLFSDGGISSNLPVHFFDRWLPRRPTFAISLAELDEERTDPNDRIHMTRGIHERSHLPERRIDTLVGFLGSIVHTAKDWQDQLQNELPGMHDRVVTIHLTKAEGGLNLTMDEATLTRLKELGAQAGQTLMAQFNFDENRWRRALSILPKLEQSLEQLDEQINTPTAVTDGKSLLTIAQTHTSQYYPATKNWRTKALVPFLTELTKVSKTINAKTPPQKVTTGPIPATDADLRLVASPHFNKPDP